MISRWKMNKEKGDVVRLLKTLLKADYNMDVYNKVVNLLADNDSLKKKLDKFSLQLCRQKKVLDKRKSKSTHNGVVYINDKHIGKKIIVCELQ